MALLSELYTKLNKDGIVKVKLKIDTFSHAYDGWYGRLVIIDPKMTSQCGVILLVDGEERLRWFTSNEVVII